MAHLVTDPSPIGRYAEIPRGIAMVAHRARNRHQTIADQSALQSRVPGGQTRGHRITGDALRQRDDARRRGIACVPILIEEGAMAQIRDAGAANFGEPGDPGRVGDFADDALYPMTDALERRSVMRRSKKDQLVQFPSPERIGLFGVMTGAARHKAAHAVADDRQSLRSESAIA